MSNSVVNNKRIAKNTIFLYIRMLLVMGISLFTVRAFLNILGETDYGLYNVIGGVVAMFSFINGTLATSSQKYFSQYLLSYDLKKINHVFRLNLTIYIFLSLFIVIFLETIGLWFVNSKMTIPISRLFAANVVYQISIVTFVLQLLTVPYNALIVSHERMKAFAYIGLVEALLKLSFVVVLSFAPFDKLIDYSILMFLLTFTTSSIYYFYCKSRFNESQFRFCWDKLEALEMLSFSGWHLFGTLAVVMKSQGVNILINMFFNPAVNAARAIAFQINTAVNQFVGNFFVAVKPQIYKSYSNQETNELHTLIIRSTYLCFYLATILAFPLIINANYILNLWLHQVPQYSVLFTQLVLIDCVIESANGPLGASILATGRIRNYELVMSFLIASSLPICYFVLLNGGDPTSTMIISILITIFSVVVRLWFCKYKLGLNIVRYVIMLIKTFLASILSAFPVYFLWFGQEGSFLNVIWSYLTFGLLLTVFYFVLVLGNNEKRTLVYAVKSKFIV